MQKKNSCKTPIFECSVSQGLFLKVLTYSFFPQQDESSSSDDDDDEDWGSDTVESGSESSDEGDEKSASLAKVFLKKWVLVGPEQCMNKM